MKRNYSKILSFVMVMAFFFSLTIRLTKEAQAASCTWEGDNGPDWAVAANWSCGHTPSSVDDVFIPDVTVDPVITTPYGVDVNTINISSGAVLTVNAPTNSLVIYTSSTFINNGEIVINGSSDGFYGLEINSPSFANDATVTINTGYLSLVRGGTHTGDFVGEPGTILTFSNQWNDQTWNFSAASLVNVPTIFVRGSGNVVNLNGEFSPGLISPETSLLQIDTGATVNLNTNDILMPAEVIVSSALNILSTSAVDIPELQIVLGNVSNSNSLNITDSFNFASSNLSGSGDINITNTVSSATIRGGTISGKTLRNNTTANWTMGNLTLLSGAIIENNSIFNANATFTMTGTSPTSFINNGSFIKNTTATTTTMNTPFTNNGTIEVIAGELIFQQDIQNGTGVVFNLGSGTLDPGDTLTLNSGDSLIGSGSLSASLVNAGTINPGSSPGIITVEGDYTQDSTGTLEIELAGTSAGTGYDQLDVNGAATLNGTLTITLTDGFEPQAGDEFTILTFTSRSGDFASINLPEGYRWELEYSASGLTLTRLGGGTISGTVTCNSLHTVFVDLYVGNVTPPPEVSHQIGCGETYSFDDLPDGIFYVGAWIDMDESGGGPPDDGEPTAWYGEPTAVIITDGETHENIDITIEGGGYLSFLPLIIR